MIYNDASDQTSMLDDMATYISKYTDMMGKLEAVDSTTLSTADAAYYAEVNARIMKKLAEIA